MDELYDPKKEPHPVCEERHYWDKRFNFAAWLFLILGLFFVIFTDSGRAALFALGASCGFRIFNSFMAIRHIKWHLANDKGGDSMHL